MKELRRKMGKVEWALEEFVAARNAAAARGELRRTADDDPDVVNFGADFVAWTNMISRQVEDMTGSRVS